MEDELVQYYIVNKDLKMSAGKLAAQVAHVATKIAITQAWMKEFQEWFNDGLSKKIILEAKESKLYKIMESTESYFIIDEGLTEITKGSLTVVGLPPMKRSDAQKIVKRLQVYKG